MRRFSLLVYLCLILFSFSACVDPIEYFKNFEMEQVYTSSEGDILKLHFVDDQTGYGYNKNTIFITTDGGNSWQLLSKLTDFQIRKLEFPEKETGYILGWDTRMYKSIDGGATWSKMNLNTYEGRNVDAMSFSNASVGALTEGRYIHLTTNGGATWIKREVTSDFTVFNDIYTFDKEHVVLFSRSGQNIFYTSDGGNNFSNRIYYSLYENVHKLDASTAFFSSPSKIMIIKDKGEIILLPQGYKYEKASFPLDESSWYLSGDHYFIKTRNAGNKYEELYNEEGSTITFNALWFFNSLNGIGVKDSKIYKLKFLEE